MQNVFLDVKLNKSALLCSPSAQLV